MLLVVVVVVVVVVVTAVEGHCRPDCCGIGA
jgi:hypothetical protein